MLACLAIILALGQARAQWSFTPVSGYGTFASSLSRDGSTLLLNTYTSPDHFVFYKNGGIYSTYPTIQFNAFSVDSTGNVFWGNNAGNRPAFWNVFTGPGIYNPPPNPPGHTWNYVYDLRLSNDGRKVLVNAFVTFFGPYYWGAFLLDTTTGGYTLVGQGSNYIVGEAISADGNTIVGEYGNHAFRWTPQLGLQDLGYPPGAQTNSNSHSIATCVSSDGLTIYGAWYDSGGVARGFKWTANSGMQNIPGMKISACSDDGNLAVGTLSSSNTAGIIGFDNTMNPADLRSVLLNNGVSGVAPWLLVGSTDSLEGSVFMSGDGKTIAVRAYNNSVSPQGQAEAVIKTPGLAPRAVDDSYTWLPNQSITIPAPGVIGNDVNTTGVSSVLVNTVSHGSLTLYSDGSFTYQPTAGFSGTDTFTYYLQRGVSFSNTATVSIYVPPASLTVNVNQRLGIGPVPDGTVVQVLNDDGTPLSPPTSTTTSSGVASFLSVPNPTSPNLAYEVKVLPPGGRGRAAVVHGVSLGGSVSTYLTCIKAYVEQAMSSSSPVGFARATVGGVSSLTGVDGFSQACWLPDGSYSAIVSMSPGLPTTVDFTLADSSSALLNRTSFAEVYTQLTRIWLTARTASGTTFIPTTGQWGINPGALSSLVNGSPVSRSFWLPNGTYHGSLSGAALNGTSDFQVGSPTQTGLRTVTVN